MAKYIPLDALVAEIERRINENKKDIQRATHKHLEEYFEGYEDALVLFKDKFLDTLEVKEVDLEKKIREYINETDFASYDLEYDDIIMTAKHFFELGLLANNPITATDRGTAEEIIINLKRVEKDYRIDLTREIEWLRNKVKKG